MNVKLKSFIFILINCWTLTTLATVELALNWKAEPEFGGFYAAIPILQKQNIDLKITEGGSGTPTIQMLAAKKVPLAIVSGDELVSARDKGMDLVALFAVYQTNPQGIMVREDSPWTSLEQLIQSPDAILAVQMGLPYVAYMKNKYPKMKAKLVPYQGGIGPFLAQKNYAQQCYLTSEPLAANKAGVKTRGFTLDAIGFNPYITVVATHRENLTKMSKELKTIMSGFREGWNAYLTTPNETDKLMQKLNPSMSIETFTDSGKAQYKLVKPTEQFAVGSMTADRWKTLAEQLKSLGLIKNVQDTKNYFMNF